MQNARKMHVACNPISSGENRIFGENGDTQQRDAHRLAALDKREGYKGVEEADEETHGRLLGWAAAKVVEPLHLAASLQKVGQHHGVQQSRLA